MSERHIAVTRRIVTHDTGRIRKLNGYFAISAVAGDAGVVDVLHMSSPYTLGAPIPVVETGHIGCGTHEGHFGNEAFTLIPRAVGEVTLKAGVDPEPECCEGDGIPSVEAEVTVKVASVDLDVDSDNNNGAMLPDRSEAEEEVESVAGGKLIRVNDDDDDDNGVPDRDQEPPPSADNDLVSMFIEHSGNLSGGTWRLLYDAAKVQVYEGDRSTVVPPDTPFDLPLTPNPKRFWIEGFSITTGGPVALTAVVDIDNDGTIDGSDAALVSVVDVELKSLDFASAHDPMRDNSTDYEPTGPFFEEPEWFPGWTPPRNAPFSHTMDSHVVIKPIIFVQPSDLPDTLFRITCTGPQGFNFDQFVTLHGALNLPTVTSTDLLEGKIQKLTANLAWSVGLGGFSYVQEQTGPHTAYITMGEPRDTDQDPHIVTQNRMERAVQEAGAANSLNPHVIIGTVIEAQGEFDLNQPRDNAWEVPDLGGDCQSIVRFADKVAKMIDIPGSLDHRHTYAVEDDLATQQFEPAIGIEVPSTHAGLNACTPADPPGCVGDLRVHPTHPTWNLTLIDGDGGCNAFEAVAKFTACNATRYYAGGTSGVYENKGDVLKVFDSLSWIEWVNGNCTIRQNEYTYGAVPENPPAPSCP